MTKISDSVKIGNVLLKNRIIVAPMMKGISHDDGWVTEKMIEAYSVEARGGAAAITVGASNIRPEGQGFRRQTSIADDSKLSGLQLLASAIHRNGAKAFIQLFFSGAIPSPLKVLRGLMPVSPTKRPCFLDPDFMCREPDEEEIWEIIDSYGLAAARAQEAGFDGVDIHAGHGGLIQQFLSPLFNQRTDIWGQDRVKFGLEVIRSIKKHAGDDFPIIWRISLDEKSGPDGFDDKESLEKWIPMWEKAGVHSFHVSAGGIMSTDALAYAVPPLYFPKACLIRYSKAVMKRTSLPVIGVAKIMDAPLARSVIEKGSADIVAVGRPISSDPDFPNKVFEGRDNEIRKCIACNWCLTTHSNMNNESRCTVNASYNREVEYRLTKTENMKRVMIIGGGVGGMETARVLHLRGHQVILFEKTKQLGGLVRKVASKIPHVRTSNLDHAPEYLVNEMERLGIITLQGIEVSADTVKDVKPDVVIIATGSLSGDLPDIKGINGNNVHDYEDYILGNVDIQEGKDVVIIGGGEGAEVALSIARKKCRAVLVEETEEIMVTPYMAKSPIRTLYLQQYMDQAEVQTMVNTNVKEIGDGEVIVETEGQEKKIPADYVIIASTRKSYNPLGDKIREIVKEVYEIGDCVKPASITEAYDDANYYARLI
ncbi:MAG: FAD-dependent oxidoreductase [Desulfobacterales bacterium]|nr:FAD-dependent oxidoreductase [Desulfobacteraceae bacterium]MBT7696856.1 FAD-dependent oxidoreductase [Desulfobacterales bacterium]